MMHFTDRADVYRPALTTEPYGGKDVPALHLADVRCRLRQKEQSGFNSLTGQWVVNTAYHVQVAASADVKVGDQLRNIRRDDGTAVSVILEITGGGTRRARLTTMKSFDLRSIGVERVDTV